MENLNIGIAADLQQLQNGIAQAVKTVQSGVSQMQSLPAPVLQAPKLPTGEVEKALSQLDSRLRVAQGNVELFGNQFAADKLKVIAYQQALNQLLASGISPTSKEALNLANHIENLSKKLERQQGILDRQAAKAAAAFKPQEGILQNLQRNIDQYRVKMQQATDPKQITNYSQTIKNLEHQVALLTGRTTALGQANAKAAQQATKLSGSANMVGMEFARIIQDAPYGMMGIGNNIQQLSSNFGQLRAQAGSTGGAMKAALAGLMSPMSLVTIGISAITAGWVLYEKWSQKSAKATKEGGEAMKSASQVADEYIATLDSLGAARVRGEQDAQKELTTLQLLYKSTQDVSLSLGERLKAVDQIQKQYPSYFKGFSDEEILAGKAAAAYDKLTTSIIATAKARAAQELIAEKARQQLINEQKIADLRKKELATEGKYAKDLAAISKVQERLRASGDNSQANAASLLQTRQLEEQNKLIGERQKLELENIKLGEEQARLAKLVTVDSLIDEDKSKGKDKKDQLTAMQELIKAFNQANKEAAVFNTYQEAAAVKVTALQNAISRLISEGISPQSKQIQELKQQILGLNNIDLSPLQNTFELFTSKAREDMSELAKGFKPVPLEFTQSGDSKDFFAEQARQAGVFFDVMNGNLMGVSAAVATFLDRTAADIDRAKAMTSLLAEFAGNAFASLGQGLGDMFQGLATGADVLANLGKALLQSVSQLAAEFGKKLLAIGTGELLLGLPTGAAKVAAGAALIVASGIGSSFAGSIGGGGRSAAPSVSTGGMSGTAQRPLGQTYEGEKELHFVIRGDDLVTLRNRAEYKKGRIGG